MSKADPYRYQAQSLPTRACALFMGNGSSGSTMRCDRLRHRSFGSGSALLSETPRSSAGRSADHEVVRPVRRLVEQLDIHRLPSRGYATTAASVSLVSARPRRLHVNDHRIVAYVLRPVAHREPAAEPDLVTAIAPAAESATARP